MSNLSQVDPDAGSTEGLANSGFDAEGSNLLLAPSSQDLEMSSKASTIDEILYRASNASANASAAAMLPASTNRTSLSPSHLLPISHSGGRLSAVSTPSQSSPSSASSSLAGIGPSVVGSTGATAASPAFGGGSGVSITVSRFSMSGIAGGGPAASGGPSNPAGQLPSSAVNAIQPLAASPLSQNAGAAPPASFRVSVTGSSQGGAGAAGSAVPPGLGGSSAAGAGGSSGIAVSPGGVGSIPGSVGAQAGAGSGLAGRASVVRGMFDPSPRLSRDTSYHATTYSTTARDSVGGARTSQYAAAAAGGAANDWARVRSASIVAQLSALPLMTRQMTLNGRMSSTGRDSIVGGTLPGSMDEATRMRARNSSMAAAVATLPGSGGDDPDRDAAAAAVVQELEKKGKGNLAFELPSLEGQSSLVISRKRIYLKLSLIMCIVLLLVTIFEYVCIFGFETVPITSRYLNSIMVTHVCSFYLFFLSFVYSNEAGDVDWFFQSLVCGVVNFTAIVLRIVIQFGFDGLISTEQA